MLAGAQEDPRGHGGSRAIAKLARSGVGGRNAESRDELLNDSCRIRNRKGPRVAGKQTAVAGARPCPEDKVDCDGYCPSGLGYRCLHWADRRLARFDFDDDELCVQCPQPGRLRGILVADGSVQALCGSVANAGKYFRRVPISLNCRPVKSRCIPSGVSAICDLAPAKQHLENRNASRLRSTIQD